MLQNKIKKVQFGPFNTSETELIDILKAWAAISIAFSIVLVGFSSWLGFFYGLIMSAITVGLGFLLHELAHKVVAQRYGCFAEFRAFDQMLLLMILMSFLGFVLAAPGAVMISGPVGKRRNGIISIAGPATNIILAAIFLLNFIFIPVGIVKVISSFGFVINTWLALFNLIPLWNFDGKKVWDWSKAVWIAAVIITIAFMFSQPYLGINLGL